MGVCVGVKVRHFNYDGIRNGTTRSSLCSTLISFNATYDFCVKFRIWNEKFKTNMKTGAKSKLHGNCIFLPYEGRHLWSERLIAIVQLQRLEYPLVNLHKRSKNKTKTNKRQSKANQVKWEWAVFVCILQLIRTVRHAYWVLLQCAPLLGQLVWIQSHSIV